MISILELEQQIAQLPEQQQRQLADWLLDRLRAPMPSFGATMAAMAADPDMQTELKKIANEFEATESDGLTE